MPSELFINPLRQNQYFVEVKNFRGRKKHPQATIFVLGNRQQDILNATLNICTYQFLAKNE